MSRISLKQILGSAERPATGDGGAGVGHRYADDGRGRGRTDRCSGRRGAGDRFPVSHDGKDIGWVTGPNGAAAVATLLRFLADKESERKALGAEVLHLYREVNLIYSFSEKLAALLDLERLPN